MIAIRDGSTLYYSLLWTTPAARQRFIERLELVQALGSTLDDVQEPQVAERKIHWWHEELQRMTTGAARHPAVRACQSSLRVTDKPHWTIQADNQNGMENMADNPALSACLKIVSAASTSRFTPPATEAEANTLLEQSYLARLALLAHALSDDVENLNPNQHSRIAARALGKHEQLCRLPQLIHRGHAVFSEELYRTHAVRPSDLAARIRIASDAEPEPLNSEPNSPGPTAGKTSRIGDIPVSIEKPGRQNLLRASITDTHAEFTRALGDADSRSHYRRAPLKPLWRLIVLRERQLALWQRTSPDLLRERRTLTPLNKLFQAWKNR